MTRAIRARATSSIVVAPVAVTDRTCAPVLGLEPRAFRELVARLAVPHTRVGRRVVVVVADLLAALDGARDPVTTSVADGEPSGVDAVLARIGRRRA